MNLKVLFLYQFITTLMNLELSEGHKFKISSLQDFGKHFHLDQENFFRTKTRATKASFRKTFFRLFRWKFKSANSQQYDSWKLWRLWIHSVVVQYWKMHKYCKCINIFGKIMKCINIFGHLQYCKNALKYFIDNALFRIKKIL